MFRSASRFLFLQFRYDKKRARWLLCRHLLKKVTAWSSRLECCQHFSCACFAHLPSTHHRFPHHPLPPRPSSTPSPSPFLPRDRERAREKERAQEQGRERGSEQERERETEKGTTRGGREGWKEREVVISICIEMLSDARRCM